VTELHAGESLLLSAANGRGAADYIGPGGPGGLRRAPNSPASRISRSTVHPRHTLLDKKA
jgi:hypothetical protein